MRLRVMIQNQVGLEVAEANRHPGDCGLQTP